MSSCLVLSNGDNVIIASDSSISTVRDNEIKRVGINQQKIFKVKDSLIFCSGLMSLVEKTMRFINSIEEIDPVIISKYLSDMKIIKNKDIFNIEIIIIKSNPEIKIYQISEYNNFVPVELKSVESSLSIYCAGFKTDILIRLAEKMFSMSRDVIKNIENIYEEIACEQIGGFVDIWKVSKDEIKQIHKNRIREKTYSIEYGENFLHSVVGDVIVGKILAGNTLTIANGANNFVLDETGATLNNAKFSIQTTNTKIIIDPTQTNSLVIQKNDGGTFNNKFWVDNSGNVNFAGNLSGATGTFSGTLSATVGNIGTLVIDANGLKTADGVNYLRGNGDLKWGGLSITSGSATFTGDVFANRIVGQIVNTQVANNAISDDKVTSGLGAGKITYGTTSGSRIFGGTIAGSGMSISLTGTGVPTINGGSAISLVGGSGSVNVGSPIVQTSTYIGGSLQITGAIYVSGGTGYTVNRSVTTPTGTRLMTFSNGILVGFS